MLKFDIFTEKEFEEGFLSIIGHGIKDNTYKFALARFLLDYSRNHTETHVDFAVIAEYFLEYYWTQICKLKMKHAPQATKKPEIVQIIEKKFDKLYYPQSFKEMKEQDPKKIEKCIEQIVKRCFHNVIWRFQRIPIPKAAEHRLFFNYKIERTVHANRKYVDLNYGINLNPAAMAFFRRYNAVLLKAVILEWARFLEKLNTGMPKIITKTEGKNLRRGSLTGFRRLLEPHFKDCFYCARPLQSGRQTHVEHVIPFDYIAEDDIWNLTLACQECNLKKLGALPPKKYLDKLVERNMNYRGKIEKLEKSLMRLDDDFERMVIIHYENAKSHGYAPLKRFP